MRIDFEPVSLAKWEEIIGGQSDASFYQTPAWARVVEKTYGFTNASRLYHVGDSEVFIPLMKKKIMGFTVYKSMPNGDGNIFLNGASPDCADRILRELLIPNVIYFDILLPPGARLGVRKDLIIETYNQPTHLVQLEDDFSRVFAKFDGKSRRLIRKAERSGVEIRDGTSLEDYRRFYEIYGLESVTKWGYEKPPLPFSLFENLHTFGGDKVKLALAEKDGKVIAGTVDVNYGYGIGFVNAFLQEYKSYSPIRLLIKDGLERACNAGYRCFDLGASNNQNTLRMFKDHLGAREVDQFYYRIGSYTARVALQVSALARQARGLLVPGRQSYNDAVNNTPQPLAISEPAQLWPVQP